MDSRSPTLPQIGTTMVSPATTRAMYSPFLRNFRWLGIWDISDMMVSNRELAEFAPTRVPAPQEHAEGVEQVVDDGPAAADGQFSPVQDDEGQEPQGHAAAAIRPALTDSQVEPEAGDR